MWLALSDGYLSVVENKGRMGGLMVRSWRRECLENTFPGEPIIETTDSDYRFRVIVPRDALIKLMVERICNIDYRKFKPTVTSHDLHEMYLKQFYDGWDMQDRLTPRQPVAKAAVQPSAAHWFELDAPGRDGFPDAAPHGVGPGDTPRAKRKKAKRSLKAGA